MADFVVEDGKMAGISDKELMGLVIGSAAGFSAHSDTVLFVGVGNMNAMCWVTRGGTRSKFDRRLMITFLMWRVDKVVEVAVCYLRTNHNVAADEITRLDDAELEKWGRGKQLTHLNLPEQWASFSGFTPHLDWGEVRIERKEVDLTESAIAFSHGKVAEWNASSYTVTGVLDGLGLETQPVDFRFGQVAAQLQRWLVCGQAGQKPLIFMGTSHTGQEVMTFHHRRKTLQPPIVVLVTPSELAEFRISWPVWTQRFWIDSAPIGDLLGGSWNVFLCARAPLAFSTVGYTTGMTLETKYADIDEEASPGPIGTINKYDIPYSMGLVRRDRDHRSGSTIPIVEPEQSIDRPEPA